jgi:hypothetical protein
MNAMILGMTRYVTAKARRQPQTDNDRTVIAKLMEIVKAFHHRAAIDVKSLHLPRILKRHPSGSWHPG